MICDIDGNNNDDNIDPLLPQMVLVSTLLERYRCFVPPIPVLVLLDDDDESDSTDDDDAWVERRSKPLQMLVIVA